MTPARTEEGTNREQKVIESIWWEVRIMATMQFVLMGAVVFLVMDSLGSPKAGANLLCVIWFAAVVYYFAEEIYGAYQRVVAAV